MRRVIALSVLAVLLLALFPTAQAAWTTSASVPSSFRPTRLVAFSYTASSSSAGDLPLQYNVDLSTCQDANANGACESGEPHYVAHGRKPLSALAGQSGSVSWDVTLDKPEGAYRYHFRTTCANNPCTTQPAGGSNDKTGPFQLAYTNTWTRQVMTTNPTSAGAVQSVTYRLASTSPDDPDLAGAATLHTDSPASPETSLDAMPYSAPANTVALVTWAGVSFPDIGTHRLRVTDSEAPDTTLDVTVRGVHLHVEQPRAAYEEGARFSLYATLEGHGSSPDPSPVAGVEVTLALLRDAFPLHADTLVTDAEGRAYFAYSAPHDADELEWAATAKGAWNGIDYVLDERGTIRFAPRNDHASLEENVTAIRHNLSDVQLKGVHLDDVGARNVWMSALRASGAVALVLLFVILFLACVFRV